MKCMCAQTRPRFILSSEGVLGEKEFEPMLTPREKSPLPENVPRGVSNPRHCGSEPKHYQLSYSGPRTAMLSLIRRQPIFYPRQVGCVIRFRRLRFLLRVASSPRIAALPSWRVHPTRVCVLRFHRIDGLSFRTCEHHLPDCYDLQQGVSLFHLHNCWELQVLLFHLICR